MIDFIKRGCTSRRSTDTMRLARSRRSAIGAAVAVSIGASGIGLVRADADPAVPSVVVAVETCRLVDARTSSGISILANRMG